MDRKSKNPTAATAQRARFIDAARQLGADEDEATFKAKLAAIARVKVNDKEGLPADPDEKPT